MKENGEIIIIMDLEYIIMKTETNIMEIGKIITKMDMANISGSEDKSIWGILKMIKKMDLDFIIYLMKLIMLAIG